MHAEHRIARHGLMSQHICIFKSCADFQNKLAHFFRTLKIGSVDIIPKIVRIRPKSVFLTIQKIRSRAFIILNRRFYARFKRNFMRQFVLQIGLCDERLTFIVPIAVAF